MTERKKKRGKQKGKEFMDAVYAGYARYVTLARWRDVEGMVAAGTPRDLALSEAGRFPERGRYQAIWEEVWRGHIGRAGSDAELVGTIEAAVTEALERENEERKRTGDRPLDEHPDFRSFVDAAFQRLFAEEAGTLEEIE